jgi:hypothetical protein
LYLNCILGKLDSNAAKIFLKFEGSQARARLRGHTTGVAARERNTAGQIEKAEGWLRLRR